NHGQNIAYVTRADGVGLDHGAGEGRHIVLLDVSFRTAFVFLLELLLRFFWQMSRRPEQMVLRAAPLGRKDT
ncbi:MAG: hypothetical protein ACKOA7_03890, partial [Bacteroidota bacterium]